MINKREQRKWDHLKHSLEISDGPLLTGFDELHLIHQALSCLKLSEIDTSTVLFGKQQQFPLIINAMTGGAAGLESINEKFAIAARECGIGLAVGSQTAAIRNKDTRTTFEIVRKINPNGLILGNISALADPDYALQAIEMVEADALQLHLNIAQELTMVEGDRDFRQLIENILIIKDKSSVPVVIKEVGFGLSQETVEELLKINIEYVDIGGAGGTNFAAIENARNRDNDSVLIDWGMPTAISLVEALSVSNDYQLNIIASGGVRSPLDIVKSLVLGANAVGIALPILEIAYNNATNDIITYLNKIFLHCKEVMLLVNAKNPKELKKCPIVFSGFIKEWLELRGINLNEYAQRRHITKENI